MIKKYNHIINIDSIEQINDIDNINKYINNVKITINFEDSSINIFNNFMEKHKNLKDIYINNNFEINIDIIQNDFEMYLFFVDCIEKSFDYILNYESHYLFDNIILWNFCIVKNVMFNFPFTLSNIIYMPIEYIKENFIKKDFNSLIRTIIHEKIHISQRYNEEIWDNYINKKDKNWIKINKNDEKFIIIETNIKNNKINLANTNEEFISNPDSFYENFKYIYKIDDFLYYGHYVYNYDIKKINIKYFELDINNKILKKTNKTLEQEHPYETYAYTISEEII